MNFEVIGTHKEGVNVDVTQRQEEWFKKRLGKFTGSKIKDLMGCGRSTAKMDWNDINKVFDFSDTALKYIYKVAMERLTGIKEYNASSFAMSFGTENEYAVKETLKKRGYDLLECDFIDYPHKEMFLGASPDGKIGETYNLEIKSAVSWSGVYERLEEVFDVSHMDFWQIQLEMLCQDISDTMYVVSYPLQADLINISFIQKSETHQKRILQRVEIANNAITLFEKNGLKGIRECLTKSISEYKENYENTPTTIL